MIPAITETSPTQALYMAFAKALKASAFNGEICMDYANRTVLATDNSIYQILPQGVVYPKNNDDLVILTSLAHQNQYQEIVLSPRGGGTGTNGQSLTDGIVVDTSKYMNKILEINTKEGWARVQCGVVKDQLNAEIKPHGYFFAPELSTSNRATLGGMINTDASGQGSCSYGKTRDHVMALKTVLMDGSILDTQAIDEATLKKEQSKDTLSARIYQLVDDIDKNYKDQIKATFPKLNRCLTGYDLAHIRNNNNHFDLNSILCGSEGTLGFISEAKLNLLPIPKKTALVNLSYDNFNAALRDANSLMAAGPTSIETIDSRVLNLAKGDIIWDSIAEFFPEDGESNNVVNNVDKNTDNSLLKDSRKKSVEGINLIEYSADSDAELKAAMAPLLKILNSATSASHTYTIAWGDDVKKIWGMRKKAVGLLGNTEGEARPMAFVEDTAVPPENLADFIVEFRALLDSHNLQYGMFGHVDAGVLHVRPILDMKEPNDEKLVREISDQVVELTHKYGGLLWGEHGKGVRSEYSPKFFGALYPLLQQIKHTFDPNNQLNPGKIATPNKNIPLFKIDEVKTRGQYDRTISKDNWQNYSEGMFCNGNGACHNWDPNDAMCPSWKGTRLRTHTPKGRASLIREWLRQLDKQGTSTTNEVQKLHAQTSLQALASLPSKIKNSFAKKTGAYDFSHEVHESMMACLACKSCTGSCPVKVDVPEFRSKFLELYYSRYLRPTKDFFVGSLEKTLPLMASFPRTYNFAMKMGLSYCLDKALGMSDSPLLSTIDFDRELRERDVYYTHHVYFKNLKEQDKKQSVIIVLDAFTRFFETELVLDTIDLIRKLGFMPWIAPFEANGKPLHVHGFRKQFGHIAQTTSDKLNALAKTNIPLIGIEPSMTLAYRSEYKKVVDNAPNVLLIQEWLATKELTNTQPSKSSDKSKTYHLLAHCTEKTNAAPAIKNWQHIFEQLGHKLEIINVGCCGMAGTYGHETANVATSKKIYSLSWSAVINNEHYKDSLVATGFSCRSQVKRIDNKRIPNPIQALLNS
jgi:FAD/FMN-containing dehydrogenase/Fe-S oxidoreductase